MVSPIFVRQIIGRREYQQDSYQVFSNNDAKNITATYRHIICIADGMGGHSHGELASQLASGCFVDTLKNCEIISDKSLNETVTNMTNAIAEEAISQDIFDTMGTTLLGCVIFKEELSWVSVGDSPLYLFRDEQLIRLNDDHSEKPDEGSSTANMLNNGQYRETASHILRSAITQRPPPIIDISRTDLRRGDIVLLATDGIESISTNDISDICFKLSNNNSESVCNALINEILRKDYAHQDNTTIAIYKH